MNNILCSIATRGRYFTTLPLVLNAVINQTLKPDKIVIFDDNDEPQDMRQSFMYQHLFEMMNFHGIQWEFLFAEKKGQHHIHQIANTMGYEWVWRVDDDAVPELNVLQDLYRWTRLKNIGAIGGSILTAPFLPDTSKSTGKIENIDDEPNIQWNVITDTKEVDHLHCSFLYRAGVYDYNLGLSRVAHREETLFTYGLKCKGYRILTVPETVELGYRQADILEKLIPELNCHGLEIELFGNRSFVIKSVPALLSGREIIPVIIEMVDSVIETGLAGNMEKSLDECLKRMACHSAIRANRSLTIGEMITVITDLQACRVPGHCPHGRPTWIEWSKQEIETLFGRI